MKQVTLDREFAEELHLYLAEACFTTMDEGEHHILRYLRDRVWDALQEGGKCKDCGGWYPREQLNDLGYCITCTELDLDEEQFEEQCKGEEK